MTRVNIIETYNLTFGKVIKVKNNEYSVGQNIVDEQGNEYVIKGIHMPTKPTEEEFICLSVSNWRKSDE